MSHITTVETKIKPTNEAMIKSAIEFMAKQYPAGTFNGKEHPGMYFEQIAPDIIKLRYAPIEGYQHDGNIHFVKNPATGIWDMQMDHWQSGGTTRAMVDEVKDAFCVAYMAVPSIKKMKMKGFQVSQKREGKELVLVATRY